jgi:hypothetical protein
MEKKKGERKKEEWKKGSKQNEMMNEKESFFIIWMPDLSINKYR